MGSYQDLKKLDEESLQQLQEGSGPSDKCICNLLSSDKKKSFGTSLKKALGITGKSGGKNTGQRSIMVPLNNFGKGAKGLQSTKQVVKRKSSCGKCGCDDNQMVLRHSYANIRITSPDISSVCPCPTDCLPGKPSFFLYKPSDKDLPNNDSIIDESQKNSSSEYSCVCILPIITCFSKRKFAETTLDKEKLRNNIKVIVEHTQIQPQPTLRAQSDQSVARSEPSSETDSQFDNT